MPLISISSIEDSSPKIMLTFEEMERFGLKPGDLVAVRAGSTVTEAEIETSQTGNHISIGTLRALGLPMVKFMMLKKESSLSLQVGPLVGIMVSRGKKYKHPPYSSQGRLLYNFLGYSNHVNYLTYVFTPEEVDIVNRTISGFFLDTGLDGQSHWRQHKFPLPDVVYNRILYRSIETKRLTKQITSFLSNSKNIKYFNPKFLNKWETNTILSQNPKLSAHLPVTKKYEGPAEMVNFLAEFNTVYLKPVHGSLGKGILRLSLQPDGYAYTHREGKKTVTGIWHTPDEFGSGLKKYTYDKPYIMQQGLDLLKYRGRVFDIRVLMQKNGEGRWVDTAIVVRVGPEGGIFPNVAAGGEPKSIESIWSELTSEDWLTSRTYLLTKQVCLISADMLENSLGTFAEIGLDIGVDEAGNVWIIEINSKPSRKVFPKDQLHLKRTSIKLPIDFAAYLAGFTPDKEQNLP